jgi:hypothetical protein
MNTNICKNCEQIKYFLVFKNKSISDFSCRGLQGIEFTYDEFNEMLEENHIYQYDKLTSLIPIENISFLKHKNVNKDCLFFVEQMMYDYNNGENKNE